MLLLNTNNLCSSFLIYLLGTSTWTISETAKTSTKKTHGSADDIEKQYANGTSKDDVLSKLKDLCYHSEYVKVARGYCHTKKNGKYYCNKHWTCKRKRHFCQGSVHHTCLYAKNEDGTGKETNVTINIILEKQNKTKEESKDIDALVTSDTTEDSEEADETIKEDAQEMAETTTVQSLQTFYLIINN